MTVPYYRYLHATYLALPIQRPRGGHTHSYRPYLTALSPAYLLSAELFPRAISPLSTYHLASLCTLLHAAPHLSPHLFPGTAIRGIVCADSSARRGEKLLLARLCFIAMDSRPANFAHGSVFCDDGRRAAAATCADPYGLRHGSLAFDPSAGVGAASPAPPPTTASRA